MAQSIALNLKLAGNDVEGESTITTHDRENTIECLYYEDGVRTAREESTGLATGQATYEPIRIVKRVDKSSPVLAQGLADNQTAEGTFRFFRPNPGGDGTTEHFFTVTIQEARIAHIRRVSPDTQDPASANRAPYEEVGFVAHTIVWKHEVANTEYEWNWGAQA